MDKRVYRIHFCEAKKFEATEKKKTSRVEKKTAVKLRLYFDKSGMSKVDPVKNYGRMIGEPYSFFFF